MNSIESLKLDFNSQIRELNNIRNKKIFDECIYVGSGDSYVAGLIAEFLTDYKCRCYSPSDLQIKIHRGQNILLYFGHRQDKG